MCRVPLRWLEKTTLKHTPNRLQVLRIAAESLFQGVPGTPFSGKVAWESSLESQPESAPSFVDWDYR
jgi:hypothetical protein